MHRFLTKWKEPIHSALAIGAVCIGIPLWVSETRKMRDAGVEASASIEIELHTTTEV